MISRGNFDVSNRSFFFTLTLLGMEDSQIRVSAARFYCAKCSEQICILTDFEDRVETVYVMPFSDQELKLETEAAAEGKQEEVP